MLNPWPFPKTLYLCVEALSSYAAYFLLVFSDEVFLEGLPLSMGPSSLPPLSSVLLLSYSSCFVIKGLHCGIPQLEFSQSTTGGSRCSREQWCPFRNEIVISAIKQ